MSLDAFESLVRRTANRWGLDVTRYRPAMSAEGRLAKMLEHHGVRLVIDVGANTGQFASGLRRAGYGGRVWSFEPLSEAHAKLSEAARGDPNWVVAPRMAIGDYEGEIAIHVAGNSVSSSLLPMLDSHAVSAPTSRYVSSELVRIATLDSVVSNHGGMDVATFLKIDTQGFEDKVLDGAREVLSHARGLQLELSFVPLYDKQHLFEQLMQRLRALGFSVWAIFPGFCDPASGRMLQVDAVLFRD